MGRSFHLHANKASLIVSLVQRWPRSRSEVKDAEGKPYERLTDLVQAIVDVPTRYVPIGCPAPDAEGKCPGHVTAAEAST